MVARQQHRRHHAAVPQDFGPAVMGALEQAVGFAEAVLLVRLRIAEHARLQDWLAQPAPTAAPLEINLITPAGELRPVLLAPLLCLF